MSSISDTMQNMISSMKSVATKSTEAPKDLIDILVQACDRMVKGATSIAGVSFISKIGGQNIFAQAERESFTSKMVNESAANFGMRGGAVAEAILGESGLNLGKGFGDFSKLAAAAVEPMQHMAAEMGGVSMSYGELGSLQPMSTGTSGMGGGMGFGV